MKNVNHIVKKHIVIKAEPSAVWDALTNPEKTQQYFFNCRVISQWKSGSPITFKGRMFFFFKIELKGEILKIEPEKLLQYTLANHGSPGHSTVTDTLEYKDGKTTLSITDDVGKEEGAEKRYKKSVKGWDKILKGLKELVESEN
ncbi:MAG: SRPBCC domain-containing protein [Flavobacterium sp.]|uniref:SRPBCC domain-containing protein n=1 Tax=Flavobacterium sp. TaxID=239 RepID=UPI0032668581